MRTQVFFQERDIDWMNGAPPSGEPKCGFDGSKCQPNKYCEYRKAIHDCILYLPTCKEHDVMKCNRWLVLLLLFYSMDGGRRLWRRSRLHRASVCRHNQVRRQLFIGSWQNRMHICCYIHDCTSDCSARHILVQYICWPFI